MNMLIEIGTEIIDIKDIKRIHYSVYDSTENGVRYYGEAIHFYLYSITGDRFPWYVSVAGDTHEETRQIWTSLREKLGAITFDSVDFTRLSPPPDGNSERVD